MKMKDRLLGLYRQHVEEGLAAIESAAVREEYRRRAEPEMWRRFHESMLSVLPRWRLLARAWHRRQAAKYAAIADPQSRSAYISLQALGGR